jgi:hypothetical protein
MHAQREREALHIGVVSVAMMVTTERKKDPETSYRCFTAEETNEAISRGSINETTSRKQKSSSQKGTTETSRCKKEFRPLASCVLFMY